jgi:hypothetical protein
MITFPQAAPAGLSGAIAPCRLRGENPAYAGVYREGPYGIRTRAAAVRGRCPRPLDEWAVALRQCS